MTISLVTGATGFIGSHLVRRLRVMGDDVWGMARQPSADDSTVLAIDLTNAAACRAAITELKPTTVFHLAGLRANSEDDMRRVQVDGTLSLLEAVKATSADLRFVVVGSAAEYGPVPDADQPVDEATPCRPDGAYGRTKHEAVLAALAYGRRHGVPVMVARPFNVVGPGMPKGLLVRDLIERLLEVRDHSEPVLRVGRLDTRRDFVDVADVVTALTLVARRGNAGEVYNVCSGVPTPVEKVVAQLVELAGGGVRVAEDPQLHRSSDMAIAYGRTEKARRELGFVAGVSLTETLASTWAFFAQGRAA